MIEQSKGGEIDIDQAIHWLVTKTGFPSFDEFRKNPDKYRVRKDDLFSSADTSSQVFRETVQSQKYIWKDVYPCESLEQVERIAKEEGFRIDELEMRPGVRPVNGTQPDGPIEILIQFWPKEDARKRGVVVAND